MVASRFVIDQTTPGALATMREAIGVVLTIMGEAIARERHRMGNTDAAGQRLGSLAALLATVSGALCSVLYRPYLRQ
jgi:hypothetical protein